MEPPPLHRLLVSASAIRAARKAAHAVIATGFLTASAGCAESSGKKSAMPSAATPAAKQALEERPFVFQPPITLTSDQEAKDDGIVRVLSDVTCTGTLVAEDLVLTAHHCVAERDEQGRPTGRDLEPGAIEIELGGDYLSWGEVKVRAVVSPDCGYRSGHGDIAILVLKRKLIGVATLTPRLESAPESNGIGRVGEGITPVGFGRCPMSHDAIHRVRRPGGAIERLGSADFLADASICPGDSGGPALSDKTGEVIGVISSSMMDGDEATTAPSFFTRIDIWRPLFAAAQAIADGASSAELPPYRSCKP